MPAFTATGSLWMILLFPCIYLDRFARIEIRFFFGVFWRLRRRKCQYSNNCLACKILWHILACFVFEGRVAKIHRLYIRLSCGSMCDNCTCFLGNWSAPLVRSFYIPLPYVMNIAAKKYHARHGMGQPLPFWLLGFDVFFWFIRSSHLYVNTCASGMIAVGPISGPLYVYPSGLSLSFRFDVVVVKHSCRVLKSPAEVWWYPDFPNFSFLFHGPGVFEPNFKFFCNILLNSNNIKFSEAACFCANSLCDLPSSGRVQL